MNAHISIASILMTLSVMRGPLLQRASTTTNYYKTQQGIMDFHIARELPADYACIMTGRTHTTSLLTENFSSIAQSYSRRDDMVAFDTSCTNCTTTIQGFGFKINCTETSQDYNITVGADDYSMKKAMDGASFFQVNITEFREWIVFSMPLGAFLRYTTLFKEDNNCYGKTKIQTCDLHAGIAEFPVRLDGDKVELEGTWKDDKFIERKYVNYSTYPLSTYS
jgi:hypothetical protein